MKDAKAKLRLVEDQADYHCEKFLLKKIKTATEEKNFKLLQCLWIIYRVEVRRLAFKTLTPIIKGTLPNSLDRIIVTDDNDIAREVTDKEELFAELLNRNIRHFGQALETPFACSPLADIVLLLHSNPTISTKLLSGNILDFQYQNDTIKFLLTNLAKLDNVQEDTWEMDLEDFKTGICLVSEGKSSSNSGRHYPSY